MPGRGSQSLAGSTEIGVIGGGASAVCLLDALSQLKNVPRAVTVFEPSPYLWRGRAYQPDSTTVLLNAPPDEMSVRFGDVDHFENWAKARSLVAGVAADHVDRRSGVRFVSRAVYGDYLGQSARAALTRLTARDCRVDLVREVVTACDRTDDRVELRTASGARHKFDYAVLCVGGGRPKDLYRLTGSPGFVLDPYPVAHQLAGITADEDVAVIGSGLTAVDVALSLSARGHRGKISMLSRRGVLPAVRQRPVCYEPRHFTPARFQAMAARQEVCTLADVVAVMRAELADAGVPLGDVLREVAAAGGEDPVTRLRRQLASVDDPGLDLRILQRAVFGAGADLWLCLSEHDKAAMFRDHYRTIKSLCCPMPPSTAATLVSLADVGQLEVVRGLERIAADPGGGFRVWAQDGSRAVGVVVNAVTSSVHGVPPSAEPLIASLVSSDSARRHPLGGLHVERAANRLTVDGNPDPRLYALGDLASGSLFFTFGMPVLVDRAHDIASAISSDAVAWSVRRAGAMQPAVRSNFSR